MGRAVKDDRAASVGKITADPSMPISGIFGLGKVAFFTGPAIQNFQVPADAIRVRIWGAGGSSRYGEYTNVSEGGGGGFSMKVLTGLKGTTVQITVGQATAGTTGSTSSFGTHISATGGGKTGGVGTGGTVNTKGGVGGRRISTTVYNNNAGTTTYHVGGGGGVGNLLGNGGDGGDGGATPGGSATSGGGGGSSSSTVPNSVSTSIVHNGAGIAPVGSTSIDFIGCGSGVGGDAPPLPNAGNGGGGSAFCNGAFPGGGGFIGAPGLVIVEW